MLIMVTTLLLGSCANQNQTQTQESETHQESSEEIFVGQMYESLNSERDIHLTFWEGKLYVDKASTIKPYVDDPEDIEHPESSQEVYNDITIENKSNDVYEIYSDEELIYTFSVDGNVIEDQESIEYVQY